MNGINIADAADIKLGGTQVSDVYYGSQKVWPTVAPTPFLSAWLVGVDSSFLEPNDSYTRRLYTGGGYCSALKVQKDASDTTTSGKGAKVEDWGYILFLYGGPWKGGNGSIESLTPFDLSSVNNPSLQIHFAYGCDHFDESARTLIDNEYTCRTFRVPASGDSIVEHIKSYPYSLNDFPNRLTVDDIEIFDYVNRTYHPYSSYSHDMLTSVGLNNTTDIDCLLTLNISANNTGDYRFISVIVDRVKSTPVAINIIQEYSSPNRIYYGGNAGSSTYVSDSLKSEILLDNSMVIKGGETLEMYYNRLWIPSTLTDTFDVTYSIEPENKGTYTWGNQVYSIFYCRERTTVTFTRR